MSALSEELQREETRGAALESVAKMLRSVMQSPARVEVFRVLEREGLHLTPVHFYSPIPCTQDLDEAIWAPRTDVPGIDFNEPMQLQLLTEVFPQFRAEYSAISTTSRGADWEFVFENNVFSGTDALALYCMIRHFRPRRIVEVGSGYSSRLAAMANRKNGGGDLICVDPFPDDTLRRGFPGVTRLIEKCVQDVDLALFESLGQGDILFIDSSHVVRTGGDVTHLFLNILPRLCAGVLVHVHDIFLPDEVRREWLVDELRFWTEQYLLQAFLVQNEAFEVVLANHFLYRRHADLLRATFPISPWWDGGSFWIRRRQ